ncbi:MULTISPECIES: putative phage tail protein [unclassified Paenibacillus]|uniref:putative phage tail protein n=1 Tax=unclassified Paenibacillus TaxID=185978 RepID=UPI00363B2D3C
MSSVELVKQQLKRQLPRRWFQYNGTEMDRLLEVLAVGLYEGKKIVEKINKELPVSTSEDSFDEKEMMLGLNNGGSMNTEERRKRIIAKQWERGGPTNKAQFENALSYLTGYEVELDADYMNFILLIKFNAPPSTLLNLPVIEDYIRRNKLAHLSHQISLVDNQEMFLYFGNVLHIGDNITFRQVM